MKSYEPQVRLFAVSLAALAGFVDALGFLAMGGFFVSSMSGNSTRLSVGTAEGSSQALTAATLIGAFVAGVCIGTVASRSVVRRRRVAVLLAVTGLIGTAAVLHTAGWSWLAVYVVAMAVGAENAVFERDGEVHIGLTYMTGSLVKLGQRIAAAFYGEGAWTWVPYLLLWLGLIAGASIGALVYPWTGLGGLWIAITACVALTLAAVKLEEVA